MIYAKPLTRAVFLASLTLTACSSTPGEVETVGSAHEAALANNALANNALANNALANNALANNALANNALANNALANNSLVDIALQDPNAREVFKYVVSCALPADAQIDVEVQGVLYTFPGGVGVAPEWGEPDGRCDDSCQQWVSACVIARLDYLGETKTISLRGSNPGLQTSPSERASYTFDEATYYGNIFRQSAEGVRLPRAGTDRGHPRVRPLRGELRRRGRAGPLRGSRAARSSGTGASRTAGCPP